MSRARYFIPISQITPETSVAIETMKKATFMPERPATITKKRRRNGIAERVNDQNVQRESGRADFRRRRRWRWPRSRPGIQEDKEDPEKEADPGERKRRVDRPDEKREGEQHARARDEEVRSAHPLSQAIGHKSAQQGREQSGHDGNPAEGRHGHVRRLSAEDQIRRHPEGESAERKRHGGLRGAIKDKRARPKQGQIILFAGALPFFAHAAPRSRIRLHESTIRPRTIPGIATI